MTIKPPVHSKYELPQCTKHGNSHINGAMSIDTKVKSEDA